MGISTSLCHSQGSWYLQKSPSDPPIPQSCPENLSCNLKGENDSWKGLQFSQTSDGLLAGGAEGPLMADASREEDDDDQGDVGLGKKAFPQPKFLVIPGGLLAPHGCGCPSAEQMVEKKTCYA